MNQIQDVQVEALAPLMRGGLTVSEEQAAVVDSVIANPFTVVDAGAGAGKTRTTVAAAFELLLQRLEASLDQFVLITFTNKAADELRRRLETTLEDLEMAAGSSRPEQRRWQTCRERLAGAYVGTIHGFCREILQTFGYGAQIARLANIDYSPGMQYEAMEEVLTELLTAANPGPVISTCTPNWKLYDLERLINSIYAALRNRGLDPARVAQATNNQPEDVGKPYRAALANAVAELHKRYHQKKIEANRVDATDLVLFAAEVLESNDGPAVARNLGRRYRYLFIDESQDTDALQKRIVDQLQPYLDRVMVVGDAKQSIYGFRGAGLSLPDIAKEKGTDLLRLSISRRPTEQLLNAYNALFRSMAARYPELGQPLKPHEGTIQSTSKIPPLTFFDAGDRGDRAAGIDQTAYVIRRLLKNRIDTGTASRDVKPGDIALLFRKNEPLEQYLIGLRAKLGAEGIDVRRDSGERFYRRREVVAVYRLLRWILDYPSDIPLALALETPYLRHIELRDVSASILWYGRKQGHELTDRFESDFPEVAHHIRELRSGIRTDTVPQLLGRMDELLELRAWHQKHDDIEGEQTLERLREIARNLGQSEQALTVGAFATHLRHSILANADKPEGELPSQDLRPSYVRLMTVHAAKGLEFPIVVLPEVQAPVKSVGVSRFVVDEAKGLDLLVGKLRDKFKTESSDFWNRLQTDKYAMLVAADYQRSTYSFKLMAEPRRTLPQSTPAAQTSPVP